MRSRYRHEIVYPGHPVTLAVLIMAKYASLDGATALGHEFPSALEDEDIPGSGDCIRMSLDLLRRIARGEDPEKAVAGAERSWQLLGAWGHPKALAPGQEQADSLKSEFLRTVSRWVKRTPSCAGPTSRISLPEHAS